MEGELSQELQAALGGAEVPKPTWESLEGADQQALEAYRRDFEELAAAARAYGAGEAGKGI